MTQQDMERVKRAVIRKYPIFAGVALFNVPIIEDKRISTAAVFAEKNEKDELILKGIKYNSDFFDNLSFDQQVFVLAHETCHIAFKHFARSLDKPEKDVKRKYEEYCSNVSDDQLRKRELIRLNKKYYNIWNIATDACINAFLTKDGLEMPQGVIDKRTGLPMQFVNIKDGLYRRAELIYDALVKKEEEKEKKGQQNQDYSSKNKQNKNQSGAGSDNQKIAKNNPSQEEEENNTNNNNDKTNNESEETIDDTEIGGGLDDIDVDNYEGIDSHDEWVSEPYNSKNKDDESQTKQETDEDESKDKNKKSMFDKIKDLFGSGHKGENEKKQDEEIDSTKIENSSTQSYENDISTDEASVFEENARQREFNRNVSANQVLNKIIEEAGCSHTKPVKPILSWKQLLIRSVDEETEKWGYRRAGRYSPNARIEDSVQDDRATTEIILDTSGSISDELLKGFLRQLVPLFKETEIKVGCFGGTFHGFTELKTIKQIEEFKAKRDNGGTNYEAAATAFTQDKGYNKINKIVFTDGVLDQVALHIQKTKVDGILWIVFGDKMNFNPLGGKIIRVNKKDLNEMLSITQLDGNEISLYNDEETVKKRR